MDIKDSKVKCIARWVDQENVIYVRWNRTKNCITTKNVIDKGKRSKRQSEVKLVKNTSKNAHNFREQKEAF